MKYVRGDILNVKSGYILQQCNCITLKPRGLSEDLARVFPNTCPYFFRRSGEKSTPGTVQLLQATDSPVVIINLFGQFYPSGPTPNSIDTAEKREGYFQEGLDNLVEFFLGTEEKVVISVPYKIGCGLAKGNWTNYEKMLEQFEQKMRSNNIDAELIVYQK